MIEGVRIKPLRVIPDERGRLMEILRRDDGLYAGFGQVYLTTAYPGVVKAWHGHTRQTDHFAVVQGMIKLALWDGRDGSPTRGQVQELFLGDHQPVLVQIPPLVYHGFKAVGLTEALLINVPTEPYDHQHPDELRLPPDTDRIPYQWDRRDG